MFEMFSLASLKHHYQLQEKGD